MSVKESWGKATIEGIYDACVAISDMLLHPSISELIVELPYKSWEEVVNEGLKESKESTTWD